ncbi:type III secretion system chaperone [Acidovorax sp. CCYZU-2555]|uniref:type III secretion system chaperone n=1 Tax=Acidovorax sp. CCYZU-2555 TaxID=2835042 RepID=UPI001BCDD2F2|nr:type III secretion system chaperone [Acidovorax sp. CCYZU-2555]MBS7777915.1 type III secretion system chaperone [Acidovorax sp. CCYZU-2555]
MHKDINRLLTDFGNYLGLESLALDENDYCCLTFDDIYLNIEAVGEGSAVLIYSSLGVVPEDAGAEVYKRLLEANYFFHKTSGGTIGLEAGTGLVAMTQLVDTANMELSDWEAVVKGFVDSAEACTELFNAVPGSAQPMATPPSFDHTTLA